jgi:hypothetical protein
MRSDVDKYIDVVTKKEWPSQRAYQMEEKNCEEGWAQVPGERGLWLQAPICPTRCSKC